MQSQKYFPFIVLALVLSISINLFLGVKLVDDQHAIKAYQTINEYWQAELDRLYDFHLKTLIDNNEYWQSEMSKLRDYPKLKLK